MDLYDRKLGFWEMFGVSWKIFCSQFKFIFITMLGLYAICTGADALGGLFIPSGLSEHWAAKVFHISNLFGFIRPVVVIAIVGQTLKEQSMSWTTIWQSVRPILLSALFIKLIFITGNLIADLPGQLISTESAPKIIPSLIRLGRSLIATILGIYFTFTYQVLFFKGKRGASAFIYSLRVVTGSWCKLFAVRTIFVLPVLVFFLPASSCDPEFVLHVFMPIFWHLFYPIFAVLFGYFTIFYTLFFLNIVRYDVRFAEKVDGDVPD
jgi:hypothetical protein